MSVIIKTTKIYQCKDPTCGAFFIKGGPICPICKNSKGVYRSRRFVSPYEFPKGVYFLKKRGLDDANFQMA